MNAWMDGIDRMYPRMVEWRRHLHQYPELSYNESETAAFVASHLRAWGLEVSAGVGGHGVVARLPGTGGGPVVALRADMDALPIQDAKSCGYASKVPGVMHACGHDAHTATLLGVAKMLSESGKRCPGDIVFLFQPAEETSPGGALPMIADGALDGVDAIYGIHLWTPFPVGKIYSREGAMMAAADEFVITIEGRGGHGGLPHETVDSVYIGSQLVVQLQSIVSRSTNPVMPCVVSVGAFHAGSSFNVIADQAVLRGTVRTFDEALRQQTRSLLERRVKHTCEMYGAGYTLDYKPGYPPVVNDAREAQRFFRAAKHVVPDGQAEHIPLIMAGEDFAYYLHHVPGCFMFVGAGNAEKGIVHPHHHPQFDIDEQSMKTAAKLFIAMIAERMNEAG